MAENPLLWLAALLVVALAGVTFSRSVFSADGARSHLLFGARSSTASGPLHRLSARLKLLATIALAVSAAFTGLAGLAFHLTLLLTAAVASRIPWRVLVGRAGELVPFVLLAAVGSLLAGEPARFALVLARASVTLLALVLLLATTPLPDLLTAARRLGLPAALVSMLGLMLRYLALLMDEGQRMALAFGARAVGPRDLRLARPLGRVVGSLAVRTIERGERVHRAMLARGYQGELPSLLTEDRVTPGAAVAFAVLCLALALIGWRW